MSLFIYIIIFSLMAALLAQGLQILWYSNALFGKIWRNALKRKLEAQIPIKMYVVSFISLFVSALLYGFFTIAVVGLEPLVDFLIFGGLMFLAFTMPSKIMHVYFSGQSKILIWLDSAFYLCAYIIFAAVFYFL